MVKEYAVIASGTGQVVGSIYADEDNLPTPDEGFELRVWQPGDALRHTPPPEEE